jgi:hypothetical protein
MISPCSSPDSVPSYDILNLADVVDVFCEFYSAECCQRYTLRSSFPFFLVDVWSFPLLFQWHKSLQISHKFFLLLLLLLLVLLLVLLIGLCSVFYPMCSFTCDVDVHLYQRFRDRSGDLGMFFIFWDFCQSIIVLESCRCCGCLLRIPEYPAENTPYCQRCTLKFPFL